MFGRERKNQIEMGDDTMEKLAIFFLHATPYAIGVLSRSFPPPHAALVNINSQRQFLC